MVIQQTNAQTQEQNNQQETINNNINLRNINQVEEWARMFHHRERNNTANINIDNQQNLIQPGIREVQGSKEAAGDHISCELKQDMLRIYFQNVNGITPDKDMSQWHMAMT